MRGVPAPRIAVGPPGYRGERLAEQAVVAGGATVVTLGEGGGRTPDGLVWLDGADPAGLRQAISACPSVRWVQLPWAGVEAIADAFDHHRIWTCAKGSFAEPVAEHALTLALAGLRRVRERITAKSWGQPGGTTLFDADVTILGGGGIAVALLGLLAPFRVRATVVRRQADPVPGAARTVTTADLPRALPGALVVFVALALTPETAGIIGAAELALMDERAWLVNVARGRHVDTAALVDALRRRAIAGAALDVTEPEPLPDGHPLWTLPNAIVTPHTADWPEIVTGLLATRITANVRHLAAGDALEGVVDASAGY
jgi:phosphoglycerate dehydrogenase-like enzyme